MDAHVHHDLYLQPHHHANVDANADDYANQLAYVDHHADFVANADDYLDANVHANLHPYIYAHMESYHYSYE